MAVISNDRMDFHFAKEATFGFDDAEQQNSDGETNCRVDTVLDARKDSHKDAGKKDDDFKWRDAPELVQSVRGRDQVSDCVDDDSRQTRVGNVEEDGGQGVDGEEDHNSGKNTGKRSSYPSFRLDGGPGERSSGRIGPKKWA